MHVRAKFNCSFSNLVHQKVYIKNLRCGAKVTPPAQALSRLYTAGWSKKQEVKKRPLVCSSITGITFFLLYISQQAYKSIAREWEREGGRSEWICAVYTHSIGLYPRVNMDTRKSMYSIYSYIWKRMRGACKRQGRVLWRKLWRWASAVIVVHTHHEEPRGWKRERESDARI